MKTSTGTPTKAERSRWGRFKEIGCICCVLAFGLVGQAFEVHHLVSGNRRMGHVYSIPLCPQHHRYKGIGLWTSIANGSKAFARVHGTQIDLWLKVQHMLGLPDDLPCSKIVSRRVA
jgi:hypothetical protein